MNDLQTLTLATPAQIAAEVVTILKDSGAIKPPEWLTAAQVAERLQCSKEHIERLAGRDEIPYKDLAGGVGNLFWRKKVARSMTGCLPSLLTLANIIILKVARMVKNILD